CTHVALQVGALRTAAGDMIEPHESAGDLPPDGTIIIVAEFLDQLEIGLQAAAPGFYECPAIGKKVDPVCGRKQRQGSRQRCAIRRVIFDAVVTGITYIELDGLATTAERHGALI